MNETINKSNYNKLLEKFSGVTYGGVIVPPKGINIAESRSMVSLATKFSKNIDLKIPLVSANMLDITESEMAIAMAFLGGIGVIHRFCPVNFQADEIRKVKRAHNFIINDPYKITPDRKLSEAKELMKKHDVGSLLVHNGKNKLLGILTKRDIRFVDYVSKVKDRMTPFSKLVTAGPKVTLEQIMQKFIKTKVKKLPLVDGKRNILGLVTSKDALRLQKHPDATLDPTGRLRVGAAIGAVGDYLERSQELKKAGVDVIVLDVTSCHSKIVEKAVKEFHKKLGDTELVVGNIGTSQQADFLIKLGVDGIKIGVGPGGACTTRRNTGIGVPQLYAIMETYYGLRFKYGWKEKDIPPLNADGNIRYGADILYALLAGASSVMTGTMLSGTQDTPGSIYTKEDGRKFKRFRGMASTEALISRYESEGIDDPIAEALKKSPEGLDREVEIRGSVEDVVRNLIGGVRSGISHRGVLSLDHVKRQFDPFNSETGFQILSESARRESYER
ncbi:MAG: IMP dehydrogenase [Parcubacteria group bacterium]|nr:IMP dehydrogenase [Parcubacteria group bacterium]